MTVQGGGGICMGGAKWIMTGGQRDLINYQISVRGPVAGMSRPFRAQQTGRHPYEAIGSEKPTRPGAGGTTNVLVK